MDPAEQHRDAPGEPVSADVHRAAARMFASGVTIAAAAHGGRIHAIAATAFCSLSLDPPMVLLAVNHSGQLVELTRGAGHVGISILGEEQREISEWAATSGRVPGASLPYPTQVARTGAPLIEGAIAWFDCEVQSATQQGDHIVIIGLVVEAWAAEQARPLVYFDGRYHALGRALGTRSEPQGG
jgi:3-hydroxy-9,10-secoandrosta-1,3,5(10)-triene-9,17-dione monooxygenase reductase component